MALDLWTDIRWISKKARDGEPGSPIPAQSSRVDGKGTRVTACYRCVADLETGMTPITDLNDLKQAIT
jgi:hypothetical protein